MKEMEKSTPLTEKQREKIKEYFKDLYIKRDIMRSPKPRGIVLGMPGKGRKIRVKVSQSEMGRMGKATEEKCEAVYTREMY